MILSQRNASDDDDGLKARPSQRRLAHYARKHERTIRRDLAELERLGLIRRGDQRRVAYLPPDRRPVVYDLALDQRRDIPDDLDAHALPQSGAPTVRPQPVDNPPGVLVGRHQRPGGDHRINRLDPLVADTGVRDEQRHPNVLQPVE